MKFVWKVYLDTELRLVQHVDGLVALEPRDVEQRLLRQRPILPQQRFHVVRMVEEGDSSPAGQSYPVDIPVEVTVHAVVHLRVLQGLPVEYVEEPPALVELGRAGYVHFGFGSAIKAA